LLIEFFRAQAAHHPVSWFTETCRSKVKKKKRNDNSTPPPKKGLWVLTFTVHHTQVPA